MIDEELLSVKNPAKVEADEVEQLHHIAAFAFQALEERWRDRQGFVAGGLRCGFVGIDRIGFADGLGEEAQATLFNVDAVRADFVPDQIFVCHVHLAPM
ncbi:hypothetical protein D9M73_276480 [compost metagenome]